MKLSEWARQNGASRQNAARLFHAGALPVSARQLATGTILVEEAASAARGVALYARVSSVDQRGELDRQVAGLSAGCTGRAVPATSVVAGVGSGVNGDRTRLLSLLRDPTVGTMVVEHRGRLAGFEVEFLEAALAAQGRRLVVLDDDEVRGDLVADVAEVGTGFCARRCGRRCAKRTTEAALAAAEAGVAA